MAASPPPEAATKGGAASPTLPVSGKRGIGRERVLPGGLSYAGGNASNYRQRQPAQPGSRFALTGGITFSPQYAAHTAAYAAFPAYRFALLDML